MSIYDHAASRFFQIVASVLGTDRVVWSRYSGEPVYPWCRLQVVNGPVSTREQKRRVPLVTVAVTVAGASAGAEVSALVGGRLLRVAHTGSAATTATALAALAPSHWAAVVVGATVTFSGSDVFGAIAYENTSLVVTPTGDPQWVELMRREATIQCTIWCRLDRDTGLPARWDPQGCDALALRVQTALRQVEPDPYRIYIRPEPNLRPFDESYRDGYDYIGVSFDSLVTWVDADQELLFGEPVGSVESVDGTIETEDHPDGFLAVDEFNVSIDD